MKLSTKKKLQQAFQIILTLAAVFFVLYKLYQFDQWDAFYNHFKNHNHRFGLIIIAQIILSIGTLTLESLKWQQLTQIIYPLTFKEAFFQVLKGLQAGMITPGRLGDPPSRVIYLPPEMRSRGLLVSMLGIMIQNIILGLGALTGLLCLNRTIVSDPAMLSKLEILLMKYAGYFVLLIITGQILLLIGVKLLKNINIVQKITSFFLFVRNFKSKQIALVIIFTLFKYTVFCFQFWLILFYFGIVTHPSHIALVAIYFGGITILPSFAIADLGLRGSIGIILFSLISKNSIGIIMSVFLLWFFNLAIPSLIPLVWKKQKKQK
jgi:hypothetical protein